jgi:NADPH2:quinone reductase
VIDWGGLAEEAVAHEVNVFARPSAVSPVDAVALPISYPTSAGALLWPHLLDVRAGKTLLVHGAGGGVGMAAVEIAKAVGATVIAVAGGDEKLALAKSRGADHVVDHRNGPFRDEVLKLTNGRGVDAVLDPVGGDVFSESIRCLAVEGRICPVGFAGGTIPSAPANILLVKNVSVVGWNYGYYVGWSPHDARIEEAPKVAALNAQLYAWAMDGKLRPHTSQMFRLEQYVEALGALASRSAVGRIAIVP